MTVDEAEELGRFRRAIARADLAHLLPIVITTLDEMINVLRGLPATPGCGVELAAALSAELHRRSVAPALRSQGNA